MGETKKIIEVLSRVQADLKAPKGQFNSFGKYKYRSCEDIYTGLKPLLRAYEAVVIVSDDIVQVGDRYYIRAAASFHCAGESISTQAFAREADSKKGMDAAQLTGSSSSYAAKYALSKLFAIDDCKDADYSQSSQNGNPKQYSPQQLQQPQQPTQVFMTEKQSALIEKLSNSHVWTADEKIKAQDFCYNPEKSIKAAKKMIDFMVKEIDDRKAVEKAEQHDLDAPIGAQGAQSD